MGKAQRKIAFISFLFTLVLVTFTTSALWGQQVRPLSGGTIRIAVAGDNTRQLDTRYFGPPSLYPTAMQIYEDGKVT